MTLWQFFNQDVVDSRLTLHGRIQDGCAQHDERIALRTGETLLFIYDLLILKQNRLTRHNQYWLGNVSSGLNFELKIQCWWMNSKVKNSFKYFCWTGLMDFFLLFCWVLFFLFFWFFGHYYPAPFDERSLCQDAFQAPAPLIKRTNFPLHIHAKS